MENKKNGSAVKKLIKKLSDPLVKSEKGEAAVQKSNIAQRKNKANL